MNKKFVSTLCIILAFLMLFGVLVSAIAGMSAKAVSKSEIEALQAQRDDIRTKQADVKEQLDSRWTKRPRSTRRMSLTARISS